MPSLIIEYIQERLEHLREELNECKQFGVNTPGFNQTLGALDELQLLVTALHDGEIAQT